MAAVLAAAAVTWTVLDDPASEPETSGTSSRQPLPALAAQALRQLSSALADGDEQAAAELAPDGDRAAAEALREVTAGARSLGLEVALRYVDETGRTAADGAWSAAVETTWRFAGDTGSRPASTEVTVRFRPAGEDRVAIVGFGDPPSGRLPVWLAGPVVVARQPGIVVVVAGQGVPGRSKADRYLRLTTSAVRVVRRVLPAWRGRVVLEVPASAAALDRALDGEPGSTAGIAALTVPADGAVGTDSPVHVFVNPDVFDRLRPTGAQVVLSHEVAHVATRAARSDAEPWLVEGFADYVALRDVGLPVTASAAQIVGQVRRHGVPRALPRPDDFAAGTGHLGATYEGAWLACVLLAERGGERALVRAYRDVGRGVALGTALHDSVGLGVAGLTRLWQARLHALAD
jgi:hypothetical protein